MNPVTNLCVSSFRIEEANQWARTTRSHGSTPQTTEDSSIPNWVMAVRSLETPFGRQHLIEAIRWAARLYD